MMLSIAQTVAVTEAEGPGRRFAVWLQGCPLRCPGCCNPEMLPFEGGVSTPVSNLADDIIAVAPRIEGISLLGGEPFAHAAGAADLAQRVQQHGLSVMIYSGFTIEQLREMQDEHVDRLLELTDLLVDGPYLQEQPESTRRWIGSTNQRLHFLSDRYPADDPCWRESNTLEIRLEQNELSVNGFPAPSAVGFWRRPPRKS